jgi:glycosyltransferase involved in cell wall biosynthesis
MRVFVGYRPRWPGLRAQALQVFASSHALASRGHEVTVCFHGAAPYGWFGQPPLPTLRLVRLPAGGTAASLAVRAHLMRWARRGPGVVLAREKRLADLAQRLTPHPVVVEAHEVDSLQGRRALFGLERRVLGRAAGLITNCEGVATWLGHLHPLPNVVRVVHNAGPPPVPHVGGEGVVYAGSLLAEKDLETVARAAPSLGGVTLLGAHDAGRIATLQRLARGRLVVRGGVAPAQLLHVLARFDVGLVPAGTGWFGRELTSPLKGFSYRSAGLRLVGARTPALRRAFGAALETYPPDDPDALVAAVARARTRRATEQPIRTWADRAREVEEVLCAVT